MFERFWVEWGGRYVWVLLEEEIFSIRFDCKPCKEVLKSKTAKKLKEDLMAYFKGVEIDFSSYPVHINPKQARVLNEVRKIPYGETMSYGELARRVRSEARAVGQALKRNPVPIVIPCHRVVAKDCLGGYSAGIEIKKRLLELEGIIQ
jgi:methylated-DNA-[protein]-cysteine S-methyltransferase